MEAACGSRSTSARANIDTLSAQQGAGQLAGPIDLNEIYLDESKLEQEIAQLVSQYFESRSHGRIARLIDEQILLRPKVEDPEVVDQVERALIDGDFSSLEALVAQPGLVKPQTRKAFLYMCYRQQFLEHIDNRESQKAFNLLQKRLKPLEHYQPYPYDFYSLSYLTTAGTVHDVPSLKDWAGAEPEREKLAGLWRELKQSEHTRLASVDSSGDRDLGASVNAGRLVQLLKQAGAWQVQQCKRKSGAPWRIASLLKDYHCTNMPKRLAHVIRLHKANVKCVTFLDSHCSQAASGSSDSLIQIFSTDDGAMQHTLHGHTSRIWDLDIGLSGILASASGDGTVRLWTKSGEDRGVIDAEGGDVYGIRWRDGYGDQFITANYDRILRLYASSGQLIRTFSGHSHSCTAVAVDRTGHMIASGSKDRHTRLWDAVAGLCISTMPSCLGEITSVEFDDQARYILAGCKDNSNRLWDLRMQRYIFRYTGHQNAAKNLIRCSFALDSGFIIGGSEDDRVYIWEREGAAPPSKVSSIIPENKAAIGLARASPAAYYPRPTPPVHAVHHGTPTVLPLRVLEAHGEGPVFDARWKAGMILGAGDDGAVRLWEDVNEI